MEFYNEQQKSLDRLLGSLNETERSYFKARLDKLQRNITLKREALKLPLTTEGKKKINEKNFTPFLVLKESAKWGFYFTPVHWTVTNYKWVSPSSTIHRSDSN